MKHETLITMVIAAIIIILGTGILMGYFKHHEKLNAVPEQMELNQDINKSPEIPEIPELKLIAKDPSSLSFERNLYFYRDNEHSVDCYITFNGISCIRSSF